MILVIGERVNNRKLSDRKVANCRRSWKKYGWNAAIRLDASGGSLKRLAKFLPENGYRVVNVLYPSNKCASWDAALANIVRDGALGSLCNPTKYTHVILLGRRVTDLFCGRDRKFGWVDRVGILPALSLPHPSGRNRFWNDGERAEKKSSQMGEKVFGFLLIIPYILCTETVKFACGSKTVTVVRGTKKFGSLGWGWYRCENHRHGLRAIDALA